MLHDFNLPDDCRYIIFYIYMFPVNQLATVHCSDIDQNRFFPSLEIFVTQLWPV
jgi:hypothetical protein